MVHPNACAACILYSTAAFVATACGQHIASTSCVPASRGRTVPHAGLSLPCFCCSTRSCCCSGGHGAHNPGLKRLWTAATTAHLSHLPDEDEEGNANPRLTPHRLSPEWLLTINSLKYRPTSFVMPTTECPYGHFNMRIPDSTSHTSHPDIRNTGYPLCILMPVV